MEQIIFLVYVSKQYDEFSIEDNELFCTHIFQAVDYFAENGYIVNAVYQREDGDIFFTQKIKGKVIG